MMKRIDDLPLDLLLEHLIPLLSLQDLLSFASTCQSLQNLIHSTQSIWRARVQAQYRFPSSATGRLDGFKSLYRKLTKPQLWVWGQASNSRLGLGERRDHQSIDQVLVGFDQVPTPLRIKPLESKSLIDLQAGGWSFHALSSHGQIWAWGTMNPQVSAPHLDPRSLLYNCRL